MKMSYAAKLALRDARHFNSGIIMVGKYHIECVRSDDRIQLITLFMYENNILQHHQYNYEKLVGYVLPNYYKTFESIGDEVFTDSWMIHELDSIRRFSPVYVDGYFVAIEHRADSKAYFRVVKEAELEEINNLWKKTNKSDYGHPEIDDYLSRCQIKDKYDPDKIIAKFGHGTFRAERSLATNMMERFGGRLIKVKVINGISSTNVPWDPVQLHVKRQWGIHCMITAQTGIPEIDCLYPLTPSPTAVVNGVFWFCDEEYWKHLWIDKNIMFRWSWVEGEARPGEIPEGTQINVEVFDGVKHYYVPLRDYEEKLSKLQSPKVAKRSFMPAHMSNEKGPFISGVVIDTLPEHDGIVCYMPQSVMSDWAHRLGYEKMITFAQCASYLFKGCIRGIPDEEFTKEFGIPIGEGKVSAIVMKKSLKSDMTFLVNEGGEEIDKPGSFLSKKSICKNPKCEYYWSPINAQYKECPSCKEPTTEVDWFSCGTEYAGVHKTDAQSFTSTGKLGSQIVKRVHPKHQEGKKSTINLSLIRELAWIHKIAREAFRPDNSFKKTRIIGDETVVYDTTAIREILEMINVFPKDAHFYQGSVGLLSIGLYPYHPRVVRKVREILAKAAITSKMERRISSGKLYDPITKKVHNVQYGYYFAAPGFGLREDEVRIPEKCKEAVFAGRITNPRYPQREGGTDSPTLKVVGWSHGNVIENNPTTMKLQGGDYDGDGLSIVPVWLTGKLEQRKIHDIPSKGSRDIESVQDVIESVIKAAEGKSGIGPVDNKITEIAFEAICLGEPLIECEESWCRFMHQEAVQSIKWIAEEDETPCPTKRLEDWWKKPPDKNPVTQVLFFDPSKKTPPKDFYKFELNHKDDQEAEVPEGKTNYYDWFRFLQRYGKYVLYEWPQENPNLSYRVKNHPLRDVLETFCKVDLSKLEAPILEFQRMYNEAFKQLAKEKLEYIKLNYLEYYKKTLVLIEYLKMQGTVYTDLVNKYSKNRDIGMIDDIGWKEVEFLIDQTRKKIASAVDYMVEHNTQLIDHIHSAIYAAGGLATSYKDKPIKQSWQMWVTELPVIRRMLEVHYRLFPSGLSPYYEQVVDSVLNPIPS